jgi:hypothetical protein
MVGYCLKWMLGWDGKEDDWGIFRASSSFMTPKIEILPFFGFFNFLRNLKF